MMGRKAKRLLASILTIAFVLSEAGSMPVVWAKGESVETVSEENASEEIFSEEEASVNINEASDDEQGEMPAYDNTESGDPDESGAGVRILNEEAEICVSESIVLEYRKAEDISYYDLIWKSSDESVAYVEKGAVTGISEGEAIIYLETADGGQDYCRIRVKEGTDYSDMVLDASDDQAADGAGSYDAGATLSYAKAHIEDEDAPRSSSAKYCVHNWLCAQYASECIECGGSSCYSASGTELRRQLVNSGECTEYTAGLRGGYLYKSSVSGQLNPGDVVFYYCGSETDGKPYVHTVIMSGWDSQDRMKVYAHNSRKKDETICYSSCGYCGASVSSVHILHFNGNNSRVQSEPVCSIDGVIGGEGYVRIYGWIFDPSDTNRTVELHLYLVDPNTGEDLEGYPGIFANQRRDDVNTAFGCGAYHGFDETIYVGTRGTVDVEIYAIEDGNNWGGVNPRIHSTAEDGYHINIKKVPASLSYDKSSISVKKGETVDVTFTYKGDEVDTRYFAYLFDNMNLAEYDPSGMSVDFNSKRVRMRYKGLVPGSTTLYTYLCRGSGDFICNKGISFTVVDPDIHVTGVKLNKTETTITAGKTEKLTATVSPSNATNKKVSFKSSNTSVATVDQNGAVSAKAKGTATITVTTEDGGKTASCKVTVVDPTIPVSSVNLNKTETTITTGKTETLTATVFPSNATNKKVSFKSSNTSVATVDQNGVVSAKAKGTATITVTTEDGSKTAGCKVTVVDPLYPVEKVELDKEAMLLGLNSSVTLTATVYPSNATNKKVSFSSNNTKIVTVDANGVVTGKACGDAVITVKTEDGGKTATCSITVMDFRIPKWSLDKEKMTLLEAQSEVIGIRNAFVLDTFSWSSSDPDVATVDKDGKVTAVSYGYATITAKCSDGSTADCRVTVGRNVSYSISRCGDVIDTVKEKEQFIVSCEYTSPWDWNNAMDKPVIHDRSVIGDEMVFYTTQSNGKVRADIVLTAFKEGSTTIDLNLYDENKEIRDSLTVKITVKNTVPEPEPEPEPEPVPEDDTMYDAGVIRIAAKQKYNAEELFAEEMFSRGVWDYVYKSDDPSIAAVTKNGVVTGKKNGSATLTVYRKLGGDFTQVAFCKVKVSKPVFSFSGRDLTYWGDTLNANDYIRDLPEGQPVSWSVPAKSKAVSIDPENGELVAYKNGSVRVTCTIGEGKYAAKYTAVLKVKMPKVKGNITVKTGQTKKVVLKNVSAYTAVSWEAADGLRIETDPSKPSIVKVTGLEKGDHELRAYVNGKKYMILVTVK